MKTFRKLVRDKMPEFMAARGEKLVTRVLGDAEFKIALENKLLEEIQEMRQGDDKKEKIAYIYEILEAIIQAHGFSKAEIMQLKEEKRQKRGGFEKRLFLEGTE